MKKGKISKKVLFAMFFIFSCICLVSCKDSVKDDKQEVQSQKKVEETTEKSEYDASGGHPGYYEYYNSKAEIENKCFVSQDGIVKFTVPDFEIEKVAIIIDNEPIMYIDDMKNPNKEKVNIEVKKTDNRTYTAYELDNPTVGEWKFQLDGNSWENVNVYLILYSKNKAAVSVEPELKDPDSGWYQAMIHIYDETGENLLNLTGKKKEKNTQKKDIKEKDNVQTESDFDVKYNIYSQNTDGTLEFNFYLSDAEKKGDEKKGYYYLGGTIRPIRIEGQESKEFLEAERGGVIDNWIAQVVLSRKKDGEKIVLDTEMVSSKEFKSEKKQDGIGFFERIKKKSKEEKQKMAFRLLAFLLVIVGCFVVIHLWKVKRNMEVKRKQINYKEAHKAMEIAQKNLDYIKKYPNLIKKYEELISKWKEWITYEWKYFQKDESEAMREFQELEKKYLACQKKIEDWETSIKKKDLSSSDKLKKLIIDFCNQIEKSKREMENEAKVLDELQKNIDVLSQYVVQKQYKIHLEYGVDTAEKIMRRARPGRGIKRGIQNLGEQILLRGTVASFCEMNDTKIGIIYYEDNTLLLVSNKELKDGRGGVLNEWENEKKELLNFGQYKYIVEINGSWIELENGAKIQFNQM